MENIRCVGKRLQGWKGGTTIGKKLEAVFLSRARSPIHVHRSRRRENQTFNRTLRFNYLFPSSIPVMIASQHLLYRQFSTLATKLAEVIGLSC